jgi:PAS domain S-box-containing protein
VNNELTASTRSSLAESDPQRMREVLLGMRNVLDQVGAYIFTKDVSGRYLYVNEQVRQLFGVPVEQIIGRDDSHFFDLDQSDELIANDRRVLSEGCTLQKEERNIHATTGEELIYWTVKSPVRNEAGEIVGLSGISTDITQRKRLERELAFASAAAERNAKALAEATAQHVALIEAQLDDAVSSMSQGLVSVDADGRVVMFNSQARSILDLPDGVLCSQQPFAQVVDFLARRGDAQADRHATPSDADSTTHGAVRRVVKTGSGRHIEINTRQLSSGHTVHTYDDVSDYVRANDQLRAAMLGLSLAKEQLSAEMQRSRQESDMKLRFVAAVSHEIRTPLNGIMGMVDVIARSGLTEQQSELIADVETSTRQLRELTDDILDLSHLKDATFSLALQPFDLTAFVDKVVRAAQGEAQAKGLMLELFMRDVPCMVIGDTQRLQQVLNNLIYNAIKFTAQGWVRLYVECKSVKATAGNLEVVIAVADSGRGIAPDALNSIFEPFRQGDDTINRDFGGTGLGLTLCRELCEAMGGSIRVASRLGKGSVFTVVVVLQRSNNGELFDDTRRAELDETTAVLAGRRILVVDDNRINQKLLALWLAEAGAQVQQAFDGAEGLRAASAELFDAILMDVSMPVMNGMTATRAIRLLSQSGDERLERLAAVPVIGVTAMARPEDLRLCMEAGMDAHLSKPLDRIKLLRSIKDVIEAHRWLRNTEARATP